MVVLSTILVLFLFEVGFRLSASKDYRKGFEKNEILSYKSNLDYLKSIGKEPKGCGLKGLLRHNYMAFMTMHPFIGYHFNPLAACNEGYINRHGFHAPDPEKDYNGLKKLMFIGSSALAYCEGHKTKDPNFTRAFRHYVEKKEIPAEYKLFNYGMPSYRLPSVVNQLGIYGSYFDRAVAIIGYNEWRAMRYGANLYGISNFYNSMNYHSINDKSYFYKFHRIYWFQKLVWSTFLSNSALLSYLASRAKKIFLTPAEWDEFYAYNKVMYNAEYELPSGDYDQFMKSMRFELKILKLNAEKHQISILVVIQPFLPLKKTFVGGEGKDQPGIPHFTDEKSVQSAERYIADLNSILDELEIEKLDLSRMFTGSEKQWFADDVHFFENNPDKSNGCYQMGKMLARKIHSQESGDETSIKK